MGANELDMVMNSVLLKQKQYSEAYTDIVAVRNAAPRPIVLKVILETQLHTPSDRDSPKTPLAHRGLISSSCSKDRRIASYCCWRYWCNWKFDPKRFQLTDSSRCSHRSCTYFPSAWDCLKTVERVEH